MYKYTSYNKTILVSWADPEGTEVNAFVPLFNTFPDLYFEQVTSNAGIFHWDTSFDTTYLIPLNLTDECGIVAIVTFNFTVVYCPCQNGGSCLVTALDGSEIDNPICNCTSGTSDELCRMDMTTWPYTDTTTWPMTETTKSNNQTRNILN